jgi:hypothetical protein
MPIFNEGLRPYVEFNVTPTVLTTVTRVLTASPTTQGAFTLIDMDQGASGLSIPHRGEFVVQVEARGGAVTASSAATVQAFWAWASTTPGWTAALMNSGAASLSGALPTTANGQAVYTSDPQLVKSRYLGVWVSSTALSASASVTANINIVGI